MKESRDRASMTCAFIYYARLIGARGSVSYSDMYRRIFGAFEGNRQLANDIWAAHETRLFLEITDERDTLKALNEIYLKPFARSPRRIAAKNEISLRVLRFAQDNHLDERTVYRRLSKARRLWSKIRQYGNIQKNKELL